MEIIWKKGVETPKFTMLNLKIDQVIQHTFSWCSMEENLVLPSPMKNIMRSGLWPTKLEDSINRTRSSLYENQFYSLVFTIFDGQLPFSWRSFNLSFCDVPCVFLFWVWVKKKMDFLPFLPLKPVQWKRTRLSRKQASPGCHDSNKVPSRKLASASQWKVTNFQIGDTSLYGRFSIFNIFMLVFQGV